MALVDNRACSHPGSIYSSDSALWTAHSSRVSLYDFHESPARSNNDTVSHLSKSLASVNVQRQETLEGPDPNYQPNNAGYRPLEDMNPSTPANPTSAQHNPVLEQDSHASDIAPRPEGRTTFHCWMRSLRRRAMHRSSDQSSSSSTCPTDDECSSQTKNRKRLRRLRHRKVSSDSSLAFVTAVRSASVSLASASAVARSRRTQTRSHGRSRTDHSSRNSFAGPRVSEDSAMQEQLTLPDLDAIQRSAQRRRVLEELIATEESYIGDLRFLINVYITILAALPTLPPTLRSSINHNLTEILQLHEEILGELHRVVPHSEYTQSQFSGSLVLRPDLTRRDSWGGVGLHRRWKSLDTVPEQDPGVSWMQSVPGILSDPQSAAEVSKVFGKKMNRFFIYKEYGAKYEMMMKDVAAVHRSMPCWDEHQKGLETLAATLGSTKTLDLETRKALTVGDLLVKPVQRICKYPLLFSELLKCTPVCDCPNSHMEVEDVLVRLREATAEINRSMNDKGVKATLEKTWLLQDRLVFPDRKLDSISKNQIRSFGHVQMCGTLHVCWQTKDSVEGQYLVCILYRDLLCLASAGKVDPVYTIVACIGLVGVRIAEVDNGRGLQCHTAPHSWKLIFEMDHQLYELIMTACTPKEELEWRARLAGAENEQAQARGARVHSCLDLGIKSLGTIYGKSGTMARRISIHRATTVGPKSPLCQVVLKNTSAVKDSTNHASLRIGINRSQSLLTTNARLPVLAPARSERARLEMLLADVWSHEILPFPGMTARARSEHLVRSSATSVMRKLSVASITNSLTKRSGSVSHNTRPAGTLVNEDMSAKLEAHSSTDEAMEEGGSMATLSKHHQMVTRPEDWASSPTETLLLENILTSEAGFRQTSSDRTKTDSSDSAPTVTTAGTDVLQASPCNSIRLKPSMHFHDEPLSLQAKENVGEPTLDRSKSLSRWVGTKGNAPVSGKSHGIRSLFR